MSIEVKRQISFIMTEYASTKCLKFRPMLLWSIPCICSFFLYSPLEKTFAILQLFFPRRTTCFSISLHLPAVYCIFLPLSSNVSEPSDNNIHSYLLLHITEWSFNSESSIKISLISFHVINFVCHFLRYPVQSERFSVRKLFYIVCFATLTVASWDIS